jgi:hypothetical protein
MNIMDHVMRTFVGACFMAAIGIFLALVWAFPITLVILFILPLCWVFGYLVSEM